MLYLQHLLCQTRGYTSSPEVYTSNKGEQMFLSAMQIFLQILVGTGAKDVNVKYSPNFLQTRHFSNQFSSVLLPTDRSLQLHADRLHLGPSPVRPAKFIGIRSPNPPGDFLSRSNSESAQVRVVVLDLSHAVALISGLFAPNLPFRPRLPYSHGSSPQCLSLRCHCSWRRNRAPKMTLRKLQSSM